MAGAPQPQESEQKPPPEPPSLAGCWLTAHFESRGDSQRDFVQADILDGGPDNRQATVLGREDVNLIVRCLTLLCEAFESMGGLNISVYSLRKLVKRQGLLFLFSQASHCFGIAFPIFGECSPPIGRVPPVSSD